jgi:hypothetical protein
VKKLVADNATLSEDALSAILRDYNTEQMISAPLPGSNDGQMHNAIERAVAYHLQNTV